MLRLDHLALSCERLADGVGALEMALGVPLAPGGRASVDGNAQSVAVVGAR